MFRKMNLMVALMATLLLVATNASSQTKSCNCANASLVGDTVGTRFNLGPGPINKVVGNPIEMPNAGPVLGAAGPAPRWNIDFGINSIRIDFLQQPATYSMGSYFTFSSLDPQLAGCPSAFISSITVTTNKSTVPFNVVSAATFGPHTVTIQIAPTGGNLDWQPGEFILVKLNFACDTPSTSPTPIDPCCPPWNKDLLKDMLFYQGSGSISAPYTLKFQPTTAFKNQMQAYINYLHSLNPLMDAITIAFRLHHQGTGSLPSPPWGPQIGPDAWVSWNWNNSGIGMPIIVPATGFFLPPVYPASPMQVGTWYAVTSGIYLEHGQKFFGRCAETTVYVRIQVLSAARGNSGPVLEFSDGKSVIKSVPLGGSQQRER
jgi:hypothetical protein